ncbi:MAG TPA: TraU family protein, partial [Caulobacteraceae bacterium]|nr:TraU family protein [Caulobacteraceae bacterium]
MKRGAKVKGWALAAAASLSALIGPANAYAQAASPAAAAVSCRGHFVNPITDTCWSCLLPISLGSIPLIKAGKPDAPNP